MSFVHKAAPLLLLVLAPLTGCGDGGGGSSGSSKQELIVKGDAACQQRAKRFAEIQKVPATTAKQAEEQTTKLIAASEEEIAKLKALNAPDDLKPKLDRYIAAKEKALGFLKDGLAAAKKSNEQAYGEAKANAAKDQVERLKLAREVGFAECSRPTNSTGASRGQ